jgi:hypothetical protein
MGSSWLGCDGGGTPSNRSSPPDLVSGSMPPRDHQAAARRHRIGIGDAQLPMRSPAAPGRWAPVRRTRSSPRASHRLPALQRMQRACRLLRSSEPPWVLGTMWSTSRALWCGGCQATARPAAFAAALGAGEHPVFDRAAERGAVAAPVPEAAGFCVSKQPTSSPRCSRKASRRWRPSCSSSSRSASLSSTAAQKPAATPPTNP